MEPITEHNDEIEQVRKELKAKGFSEQLINLSIVQLQMLGELPASPQEVKHVDSEALEVQQPNKEPG